MHLKGINFRWNQISKISRAFADFAKIGYRENNLQFNPRKNLNFLYRENQVSC